MDRLNNSLNNHIRIRKKERKLKILYKSFALVMAFYGNNFIVSIYLFGFFPKQSHLSSLNNGIYSLR